MSTLLGIWAHPDDEAFVAGGLIADAVRRGDRVVCLHMTRGEAGLSFGRPSQPGTLSVLRTHELDACMEHLGVDEQHFFDYPDGALAQVPPELAIARLVEVLQDVQPDTIVTFGDDGYTGHPDHKVLAQWVAAAFDRWDSFEATLYQATLGKEWCDRFVPALNEFDFFWPGHPQAEVRSDLTLEFDDELVALKIEALKKHASQMRPLFDAYGEKTIGAMARSESYRLIYPAARAEGCCAAWLHHAAS